MDNATWLAVTIALTAVSAVLTWLTFRRRGLSAGMLGAGITLLFPAAYLTNTLRMFTRIASAIADWGTSLVLSPVVWAGIACGGLGLLLIAASRSLASRGIGQSAGRRTNEAGAVSSSGRGTLPSAGDPASSSATKSSKTSGKGEPVLDDDLADIEAILRKRGIS